MNKKTVIANWKLNGNRNQIINFINLLNRDSVKINKCLCKIIIAFPTLYLDLAQNMITNKNVFLAAQNVDIHLNGAFTGEVSINMLKDIGIGYVIIGHSERRIYHRESNNIIANKFKIIKDANLIPILCIGENKKGKKLQQTKDVCKKQLDMILQLCGPLAFQNTIIAYEPVWAIGSGKIPTLDIIQDTHAFIRTYIVNYSSISTEKISIHYGGSVNEINIEKILQQSDVDGVLVGNASLNYNQFIKIINIINMI
ncbi:MAG TPA: triose-phosphate isomerase [Buchnera sp. (in: enterobacteria)]|nr:triose-phosphate isomerase [Buchnera sp. (in: enterobacteria)]